MREASGPQANSGVVEGASRAQRAAPPRTRGEFRPSFAAKILLRLIGGYKSGVSPSLGTLCRYQPTCSAYAHDAIERHGAVRGAWLAARRVLRCTPLGRGGWDPVP